MLEITADPIGKGRERSCYVHPEDPRKAIKICHSDVREQTNREIRFYRKLSKQVAAREDHIPKFYGLCDTNLGKGIVVDLIRNYDGEISRPMNWYLSQGLPIERFEACLEELRYSFLQNLIIFNHDMTIGNMLVQKSSLTEAGLIVIDGLGDVVALDWLNLIPALARRKIERRWDRFIARAYRSREVRLQRGITEPEDSPSGQS
jgi:hypothetical protein